MPASSNTIGKRSLLAAAAAACCLALISAPAAAQGYPERAIKVIVPFAPGGSTDLIGRIVAKVAEQKLGKPLVIENKPGAGTMIGLIGMVTSTLVLQPLYGNTRYDYPNALQALAQVAVTPPILATGAQSEWKTLKDLLDYAKANPKKVKYGITGVGNSSHIGPAQLARAAGIEIEPVTFDGGGPLMTALLGGHIAAAAGSPVDYKSQIEAGKLRALVSFGPERSDDPLLKDVPTAKELGYDAEIVSWTGVAGPKGLSPDIVKKLSDAFMAAMADPEVKAQIEKLGSDPVGLDANGFAQRWSSETAKLKQVVAETGILDMVKSQKQ
jgi:tripartite-type tricarboxylate transporter receptor subunit TctC